MTRNIVPRKRECVAVKHKESTCSTFLRARTLRRIEEAVVIAQMISLGRVPAELVPPVTLVTVSCYSLETCGRISSHDLVRITTWSSV